MQDGGCQAAPRCRPKARFWFCVATFAAFLLVVRGDFSLGAEPGDQLRACGSPGQFGRICVEVSSRLSGDHNIEYGPANLIDQDPSTAWVEGVAGDGVGEWILMTFERPMKFSRLFLRSGYCKNEDLLLKNNAPRTVRITTEGGERTVELERTLQEQTVHLPNPVTSRWIKLEIRSVYPGSNFQDTAVSELSVDFEEFNYETTGDAPSSSVQSRKKQKFMPRVRPTAPPPQAQAPPAAPQQAPAPRKAPQRMSPPPPSAPSSNALGGTYLHGFKGGLLAFTFTKDGTWTSIARDPGDATKNQCAEGKYTISGNEVTMTTSSGVTGKLTINRDGNLVDESNNIQFQLQK